MSEFDDLRKDALATHDAFLKLAAGELGSACGRLLAKARGRLADGRYSLVVCGEFRRGKSSLLNALVEQPGLFPVDVDITTCATVTLRWAPKESATVHFAPADPGDPASAAPPPAHVPPDRIAEFVTEQENPGNAKNVLRIDLTAAIPQLKSGLELTDTPGLGSLNPGHTAATRAALSAPDAVLFVASAVEPLGKPELDILTFVLSREPIVISALTMIDRVIDATPVVDAARARISRAAAVPADELVIVPVSSSRKFDALETQDAALLAESGFPELEAEIWGGLAITCGAVRVHDLLDELTAALTELAAPVQSVLTGLRVGWAQTDAELKKKRKAYQQLKSDSHGWRRDLQNDAAKVAGDTQRRLERDFDEIAERFRRALGDDEAISDPDAVIQRASTAMVDAADRAQRELDSGMGRVAAKYAKLTALSIDVSDLAGSAFDASGPVSAGAAPKREKQPQAYRQFREMWLGGLAGLGVGSFLGPVGAVAGFFVGLFSGRRHQQRTAEEQARRQYIAELRGAVLPKLEAGRRRTVQDVAEQGRAYSRALTKTIEDRVTAKCDALEKSIRKLEAAQRDPAGRAAQENRLVQRLQEFTAAAAEFDALRRRTDGLSQGRAKRPGAGPAAS